MAYPTMKSNGTTQRCGTDNQGNPIGDDGKFIVSRLETSRLIEDADFLNPTRNVELPKLPANTDSLVGGNGRSVLIKRSLVINDKPATKPNYWVLVNINGKYAIVNIDSDPRKTHVEIVGWRWSNLTDVERIKKRAISEGGQVLITNPGAAGLSALQDDSRHRDSN